MRKLPVKDMIFVALQFILFVIYFVPLISSSLHLHPGLKYGAGSLVIIGLSEITIATWHLNKNLTPFPTPKEGGTLIQTGIYNYIRHPIYSGIILTAIGFGFFRESSWKIGIGIVLWILFFFKSRYEETMLINYFKEYEAYRSRTNRFFPFL